MKHCTHTRAFIVLTLPTAAPTTFPTKAPTKAPTKGVCIVMNSRARFLVVAASNTTYSLRQYETLYSHSRVPRSDPAYCSADDVSNQGSHKSTDERCVHHHELHRHELPRSLRRRRRVEYNVFSWTIRNTVLTLARSSFLTHQLQLPQRNRPPRPLLHRQTLRLRVPVLLRRSHQRRFRVRLRRKIPLQFRRRLRPVASKMSKVRSQRQRRRKRRRRVLPSG